MPNPSYPVCLASHGPFSVVRCPCGSLSLHLGALTLRFHPDTLVQLAATLNEAILSQEDTDGFHESNLDHGEDTLESCDTSASVPARFGWTLPDADETFH